MSKHAYLIIADKDYKQLHYLLSMIDDERNDIYIHIDKKVKFNNSDKEFIQKHAKKSKLYWIPRIDVNWAGPSQVKVELNLFKFAFQNGNYSYFHLLSGKDLPLQTQDYIHSFLDDKEINLVTFTDQDNFKKNRPWERIYFYHFFSEYSVRSFNNKVGKILIHIYRYFEKILQRILKTNRCKKFNIKKIGYGTNWLSLNNQLVKDVVKNYNYLLELYKHSNFGDELLIQTFILNSKKDIPLYKDKKNSKEWSLRYIDWDNSDDSGPHIWRKKDFNQLVNAHNKGFLFARKFNENIDRNIIVDWVNYLKKRDEI